MDKINSNFKRPPLGLMPKWLWIENRQAVIMAAVSRYKQEGKEVPKEWLEEYFELSNINNKNIEL